MSVLCKTTPVHPNIVIGDYNPFRATYIFLYPLKMLENLGFLFPGSIERDQWHERY